MTLPKWSTFHCVSLALGVAFIFFFLMLVLQPSASLASKVLNAVAVSQ